MKLVYLVSVLYFFIDVTFGVNPTFGPNNLQCKDRQSKYYCRLVLKRDGCLKKFIRERVCCASCSSMTFESTDIKQNISRLDPNIDFKHDGMKLMEHPELLNPDEFITTATSEVVNTNYSDSANSTLAPDTTMMKPTFREVNETYPGSKTQGSNEDYYFEHPELLYPEEFTTMANNHSGSQTSTIAPETTLTKPDRGQDDIANNLTAGASEEVPFLGINKNIWIGISAGVSIIVLIALFTSCGVYLTRRKRKSSVGQELEMSTMKKIY